MNNQLLTATVILVMVSYAWADKVLLEQKILNQIFDKYDRRVRPYGKNTTGPVVVEVNTYVRSINDLDDLKMVYSAQLTFRQKWQDDRFRYDPQGLEYVTLTSPDRMWVPDLFFSNEMKAHLHKILTPNNLIRIYPDGHVLYSTRVSLELSCPMNLRSYPMDIQNCEIKAASYAPYNSSTYDCDWGWRPDDVRMVRVLIFRIKVWGFKSCIDGYTTSDIVFLWKQDNPVQVSQNIYLPKFTMKQTTHDYCTSKTNTGEYSCIKINLQFSREFTFYLLQAYMPTLSLVILSWITFWLHPTHSLPLRLGIWMGVLLSMILVTTSVGDRGPRVSYIKAIDVWMGTCIMFVFCVLVEMALVSNVATKAMSSQEEGDKTMGMDDGAAKSNSHRPHNYSASPLRWLNRFSTRAERIDGVSRILFPAAFAFFNFVYWLTYMSRS